MEREGREPNQSEQMPNLGRSVKDYLFYRSLEPLRTTSSTREERTEALKRIQTRHQALRLCHGEYPYLVNLYSLASEAGLKFKADKIKEITSVVRSGDLLVASFSQEVSHPRRQKVSTSHVIPIADRLETFNFLREVEELSKFRH